MHFSYISTTEVWASYKVRFKLVHVCVKVRDTEIHFVHVFLDEMLQIRLNEHEQSFCTFRIYTGTNSGAANMPQISSPRKNPETIPNPEYKSFFTLIYYLYEVNILFKYVLLCIHSLSRTNTATKDRSERIKGTKGSRFCFTYLQHTRCLLSAPVVNKPFGF